jgi:ACS family D-galactonate transporter-like MFS transporter
VLALASANALPAMTVVTLGIVLPEVRASLRLSEVRAGSLFSVLFVAASLASLAGGPLADRAGRFTVVLSGLALLAAAGLIALTDVYALALVFLGLAGIGYGFASVGLYALLSDLLPARRGLGTGLLSVTYGTGALVGPLLASAMTAAAGWRAAFVTVGAIALAMTALQALCRRAIEALRAGVVTAPPRGSTSSPGDWVNRDVALVTAASFCGGVLFWATSSWAPTVLRVDKGLTLGEAAVAMAAWGAMPMVGAILVGLLTDRLGRRSVMLSIAFPGALVVIGVYTLLHSVTALALGFALLGLIRSPIPSQVVALGQDSAKGHATATASGLVMAGYYAAAVVVPLLTGAVIARLQSGVWTMAIVVPLGLVLYGALVAAVRERSRSQPR